MQINLHVTFETEAEFAAYARNFLGQDVVLPTAAVEDIAPPAPSKPKRTRRSKKQIAADAAAKAAEDAVGVVTPEQADNPPAVETTDITNVMEDDYTPDTKPKMEAEDTPLDAKEVLTKYISVFGGAMAKERVEKAGVKRIGQLPPERLQEVLQELTDEMSLA